MRPIASLLAGLLAVSCCPAFAVTAKFSPAHPIAEPTQGGPEFNFDLLIHNEDATAITLTRLEVVFEDAAGRPLLKRELNGQGSAPNIETVANRRVAAGAEHIFFNPFPQVPPGLVPAKIRARLEFSAESGATRAVTIDTTISARRAVVVALPLAGRIDVRDGHDSLAHHRRWNHALPYLRGLGFASNAMRYSYDFVLADGESLGAPVLAVANGKVIRKVDHHPDDGSFDPQTSLADSNALFGNYLVIDQGDGVFALYGHLAQHSAPVAVGDSVKAGQRIGAVGRSGSADAPHLHFQIMDAPDMSGEGVPSLFRNFSRVRGAQRVRVRQGAIGTGEIIETDFPRK